VGCSIAHQIDHRRWRRYLLWPDRNSFHLGLDQLSQRLLIAVAERARIEITGSLSDDRTGNCHHLGIEVALGAAGDARTSSAAQREQRHPSTAWLDDDHPLTPAEGEPPEPDNPSFSCAV
jgi:hypothetical protein